MKKQFISSFSRNGEAVDDMFAVKFKKPPSDYKGAEKPGKWFEARLADSTGEVTAKYWGREEHETERVYSSFGKGDIVHVKGVLQEYPPGSGKFSISIDASKGELRKCPPSECSVDDFVAKSKRDVSQMLSEASGMLSSIRNPHLRALVDSFTTDRDFVAAFSRAPAAMEYHQNYIGGLLEHTLNAMKMAASFCDIHAELDRDLVLAGTFLHDIGKVKELGISGAVIDVTEDGMMIGHITIGYEMVAEKIESIKGFPRELRLKVLHIMLSHHGLPEYGSPKKPQLPEAVAVHQADEADAKIDIYLRLKREASTEDPWVWTKKFGHIYLK